MQFSAALQLAALITAGFLAQWLAWRVRLPAIVFLLLIGLILGPALGWLNPEAVLGELFFPVISLGVAIILFEGAATLRFREVRGLQGTVLRLVTVGAVVTMGLLAVAAHYIAGLSWGLAALFGALTCVTGPTVIAPILRSVRPNIRIANVLRWEGIVIDPIGALLAVLVYEIVRNGQGGHSWMVFGETVLVGSVVGAVSALVLAVLLRRHLIPEFLQTYGTLALVLLTFSGSNQMAEESGLLAVTVMGMILANIKGLAIEEIVSFKEHLSTLLISGLFIMLAARMPWPLPPGAWWMGLAILLIAQLIVRPVAVWVSTVGGGLNWRERALIAWIAPRGIVAAAVSALFALKLDQQNLDGSDYLVPLTFALIIGTVVLQSFTAGPIARRLNVLAPKPRGVLLVGANEPAREIAKALIAQGFPVRLADDDWFDVRAARMDNLPTWYGDPVSERAVDSLDLSGIGQLFAMSSRRELNNLACVYYRSEFGRNAVYELAIREPGEGTAAAEAAEGIKAPYLFGASTSIALLHERLQQGWRIKATRMAEAFGKDDFFALYGQEAIALFSVDEQERLRVVAQGRPLVVKTGWTIVALVPPKERDILPFVG
ncbi:sodium:proton antiporter [Lampropedia puyangensis]|uniref:Sodium:proton antiporter n=1 Tax=Lampropedia puyangensis TaxID=1330072 RepID=A0A4S8FBC9_9BURK|nr:sodium:proton antiporter [Lampropedia puyangensis]THU04998.1 sodium:proton antiporter [Lampropedia puyangensis]